MNVASTTEHVRHAGRVARRLAFGELAMWSLPVMPWADRINVDSMTYSGEEGLSACASRSRSVSGLPLGLRDLVTCYLALVPIFESAILHAQSAHDGARSGVFGVADG